MVTRHALWTQKSERESKYSSVSRLGTPEASKDMLLDILYRIGADEGQLDITGETSSLRVIS